MNFDKKKILILNYLVLVLVLVLGLSIRLDLHPHGDLVGILVPVVFSPFVHLIPEVVEVLVVIGELCHFSRSRQHYRD